MGSGSSKPSENTSSNSDYKPTNSVIGVSVNKLPYTIQSTPYGKRALLVGCNYIGTSFELSGCINDVNTVEQRLNEWGYSITKMTDYTDGTLKPTWQNIVNKLTELIDATNENDCLIIYYSGHGSSIADTNGDEISGRDSTIVPLDVRRQGYIIDDKLREIFTRAKEGAKIFAVFDSCNSGSVCDLRCNLFDTSYKSEPFIKQKIYTEPKLISRYDKFINNRYSETDASIVSLSGCKDDQYSYEIVSSNGNPGGALTYSFISCLNSQTPNISFETMLFNIKSTLSSLRLTQNPSLMCGKEAFNPSTNLSQFLNI
jgi:hypothetical protein